MSLSNQSLFEVPGKALTEDEFKKAQEIYHSAYCYSDWCVLMTYNGLPKTPEILRWAKAQEAISHMLH